MNIKLSALILYIILLGLPQLSETLITPSFSNIADTLETSNHMIEFSLSIFFIGFALGVSFWGVIADHKGRRPAMLFGLIIFAIGSIGCALSTNINLLLIATFTQSFGASAGSVVIQTVLRDICTDKERPHVFNIVGMALAFSPALGPLLGNYINSYLGWRYNYGLIFIFVLGLLFYTLLQLTETRPAHIQKRTIKDIKSVAKMMIRDPFIWICSLLIGICNSSVFSFFAEGPFIFIKQLDISEDLYGWIGLLVSASSLIGGYLNRKLIKRYPAEHNMMLGAISMLVGSVLYLGFSLFIFSRSYVGMYPASSIIFALFFVFMGYGMIVPNTLGIALRNYRDHLGTAGSIFGFSYYVFISLLTAFMSWIHDGSILPLPLFMLAFSVLAFGVSRALMAEKNWVSSVSDKAPLK